MNKVLTAICCISLACVGYFLTNSEGTLDAKPNALYAATIPYTNYNGPLPLDLKLDLEKEKINDDVKRDTVIVTNTKYVRVPVTKRTTDTIYVANIPDVTVESVKNKGPGDRKEGTPDEAVSPKPTVVLTIDELTIFPSMVNTTVGLGLTVVLTIDGKMVYSSENVIQSGGSTTSASDGPLKP